MIGKAHCAHETSVDVGKVSPMSDERFYREFNMLTGFTMGDTCPDVSPVFASGAP